MKLRVWVDGRGKALDTQVEGGVTRYEMEGVPPGSASIEEVRPGVFSVLLGTRSFMVNVAPRADGLEVVNKDGYAHTISVADTRDRSGPEDAGGGKGPALIRAQMPGKVVRLLVDLDDEVKAGQGLMVVEAMKMQNEVKSPKSGTVVKIAAGAGDTVTSGQTLMIVE